MSTCLCSCVRLCSKTSFLHIFVRFVCIFTCVCDTPESRSPPTKKTPRGITWAPPGFLHFCMVRNTPPHLWMLVGWWVVAGWLVGWLAGWLAGWVGWAGLAGWLAGWLVGWLVGWLAGLAGLGWLAGWLVGWLAGYGILVSTNSSGRRPNNDGFING